MLTKEQINAKFGNAETKTIKVAAWGGEVSIRKLRAAESNQVSAILLKDIEASQIKDKKVELSVGRSNEAAILAVSFALVEPAMTVHDLSQLDAGIMEGVQEIKKELDEWDKPKKSQKPAKVSSD